MAQNVMADAWVVTATELDVVWESLRLPPRPLIFGRLSPGKSSAERARIVDASWDALVGRRLADEPGEPIRPLAKALTVIGSPTRAIELRGQFKRPIRVYLAATRDAGALATLRPDDQIAITSVPPTGLAHTMVGLLTPTRVGPGYSVTLRAADFYDAASRAGDSAAALTDALEAARVNPDDARMLITMITGVTGTGQFTAVRIEAGREVRAPSSLAFHRTTNGGYAQTRSINGGTDWLTITPADNNRLTSMLDDYLSANTDDGRR